MKRRILVSLLVIAVVAGLVGAGTFALFSDVEVSSGHEFAAATLNLTLGGSPSFPIVLREMAPGVESAGQTVTANNSGSVPGKVNWEITSVIASDGSTGTPANSVDVSASNFAKCVVVSHVYFDRDTDNVLSEPNGANGIPCTEESSWTGLAPGTPAGTLIAARSGNVPLYTTGTVQDTSSLGAWKTDDELVTLDWIQWGDFVNGNDDGKLTIAEIDAMAPGSWNIDDTGGATSYLDGGETYTHVLKFTLDDSLYSGDPNDLQADGIAVTVTVTLTQYP